MATAFWDWENRKEKHMESKEELKKMAQTFREAADIMDEIAEFEELYKDTPEEERKKIQEGLLGRFAIKMLEIQASKG